jgi:RecA/RadA recombinase
MSKRKKAQPELIVTDSAFDRARQEVEREIAEITDLPCYSPHIALRFPSFALKYLIQYEGFPLGCFVMIVGKKGSFKSLLSIEMAKWHAQYAGLTILLDSEGGAIPLAQSILGKQVMAYNCAALEDWQVLLTRLSRKLGDMVDNGAVFPVCYIIDSIVGAESKDVGAKIEEEGFNKGSYPVEAKLIAGYLRHKNRLLLKYPFTLVGTNHLREVLNPMTGTPEERIPGGTSLEYHAHLILKTKKTKRPEFSGDAYEGAVTISVEKDRLGAEGKSIDVPIRFFRNEKDETVTEMNWHQATAELLSKGTFFPVRTRERIMKRLREIINVESKSAGPYGLRYYCKELDISADDAVNADELSLALEARQDILDELYRLFLIRKAPFFQQGTPYAEQLENAAKFGLQSNIEHIPGNEHEDNQMEREGNDTP